MEIQKHTKYKNIENIQESRDLEVTRRMFNMLNWNPPKEKMNEKRYCLKSND